MVKVHKNFTSDSLWRPNNWIVSRHASSNEEVFPFTALWIIFSRLKSHTKAHLQHNKIIYFLKKCFYCWPFFTCDWTQTRNCAKNLKLRNPFSETGFFLSRWALGRCDGSVIRRASICDFSAVINLSDCGFLSSLNSSRLINDSNEIPSVIVRKSCKLCSRKQTCNLDSPKIIFLNVIKLNERWSQFMLIFIEVL